MKKTRILCLLLALVMCVSIAACGKTDDEPSNPSEPAPSDPAPSEPSEPTEPSEPAETYEDVDWEALAAMDYEDQSYELYDRNLGEFGEAYATAKAEVDDTDLRLGLMAIAEAKLMESGVFMPISGNGGSYAMSRVVPRSAATVSWGLDEYKFYTTIVCNEIMKSEDRTAVTALWKDAPDAETFMSQVKTFLADNGYTTQDVYNTINSYDIETWDVIATSMTSDSYFLSCTYSGLLEYDQKDNQQPAIAESYDVSDDGTVYTFHLRQGVKWVDQQGREIGEVTADDWVASLQHLIDNADGLGYLLTASEGCGVKNFEQYLNGEITDFNEVGIKAIDDYTLEYTLEQKFPAFTSLLGYGCFAPLNRAFYKAQGGTFSTDGDEYTAGNYGTSPDTIAYNGAFLCTNFTAQNITSYKANPTYWNADKMNVHEFNVYYNDGTDPLRTYNDCKAGTIAACSFTTNTLPLATTENPEGSDATYFDAYHYTTTNDATCYCGWLNLHRGIWHNFNDETQGISTQTEEDAARTRSAMNNKNFRLAIVHAFDRGAYNAAQVGEDLKYASLKNSYTPGTFMSLANDLTIDINGESKTFPAGTYFGEIEQAQLDADDAHVKCWDPTLDDGIGSGDGFDGWLDVDYAKECLAKAVEELAQVGIEVSKENPIKIDSHYLTTSQNSTNSMNTLKQTIEANTDGLVEVDLIGFDTNLNHQYCYYRNPTGDQANFDFSPGSGWGPDYRDVQTFLDTIQAEGYMTKCVGLW